MARRASEEFRVDERVPTTPASEAMPPEHLHAAPSGRRVVDDSVESSDRTLAVFMHLWPILGIFVAPLGALAVLIPIIGWFARKDRVAFIDDHGRELVNVLLTGLVFGAACMLVITVPFFLVWLVVALVSSVRGAIAAGRGEYFRYPMTIRFLG